MLDQRGKPTGEFNISFVVNDFRVSSKGTRIDGKNFEVFDKAGRLMFSISPEGSKIRVEKGVFRSTEARKNVLQPPAPPTPMTYDTAFYYKDDKTSSETSVSELATLKCDVLNRAICAI